MVMNDLKINGSVQMNTLSGGYLNMESLKLNISVGSVDATLSGFGPFLDGTISALFSAAFPALISESQESLNELISESLIPQANEALNQYRLIDLLLTIVTSILPRDSEQAALSQTISILNALNLPHHKV